jgi:uncharacterized protein
MIIDSHAHFGKNSSDDNDVSLEKLKAHMKKNKIDYVCLFPFTSENLVDESLKILELSNQNKFIIPFLRFDPNTIKKTELQNLLKKNFKGVKLHPRAQNFDSLDKRFEWIFEMISESKLPLIFHCKSYHFDTNSHPEKLMQIAKKHPDLIVILGHFAGVNKLLFSEFLEIPNLWVETSIDVTPNAYREVVLKTGFDRLLFGTDFPYSFGEVELMKLHLANLPKHINDKILYKNAQKLFLCDRIKVIN